MDPSTWRQHPLFMVFVPLLTATLIIAAIILWRWQSNRAAWAFHPRGSSGFLHDEFLRLGAIFIPYALLMVGVRFYVYDLHPELMRSPAFYIILLSVFVFRRLTRYIPFVREAGKQIDAARAQARDASKT